jgi:hypothetical protein
MCGCAQAGRVEERSSGETAPLGGDAMTTVSERASIPTPVAHAAGADSDIVEEWGLQSFPASDPPANW